MPFGWGSDLGKTRTPKAMTPLDGLQCLSAGGLIWALKKAVQHMTKLESPMPFGWGSDLGASSLTQALASLASPMPFGWGSDLGPLKKCERPLMTCCLQCLSAGGLIWAADGSFEVSRMD